MLAIPDNVLARYNEVLYRKGISFVRADKLLNSALKQREVHETVHAYYRKWLRYFLDFCEKHPPPASKSEQVRLFIEKLKSKNQPPQQCSQAANAVFLYFESQKPIPSAPSADRKRTNHQSANLPDSPPKNLCTTNAPPIIDKPPVIPAATATTPPPLLASPGGRRYNEWRCLEKTQSPGWDRVIDLLTAEIKVRHYSCKTLKTYANWSRKFQHFLTDKPPGELSSLEVKNYLTHLAVQQHVASSTQNQAFNALLFLFRHVLKKDFGDQRDVPRAKKSKYIPVVLSRPEIDAIINHFEYPFDIVVSLLYGCGLRLFECLGLRVHNFIFDEKILTVHGKGSKDRTVPLPERLIPNLKNQLAVVSALHDLDIAAGYSGVFLVDSLEKKYPATAKDFIWQWFLPQKELTPIPGNSEHRPYHLHESQVQDALKKAARMAKLTKRVKSHTFRHSFATHLLQAN